MTNLVERATFWRRLVRHRTACAGLILVLAIALLSLLAPLLPVPDPTATELDARLLPPLSHDHLLGTDQLGRDVLSRLLHGTRLSLAVAVLGTLVAAALGSLVGIVAGYYGKLVDTLLMRGVDVLMAFPYLLLALAIVAVLGPSLKNATLAIAIVNIPFFARTVRGATLALRREDFVAAARVSGLGDLRILFSELLPNVVPVIIVAMSTTLGWMILETAGLSFLGLGAQPPTADLGGMLGQGRYLMATHPHVSLLPGALILLLVVGVNLFGDGLRDVLDPKARHAAKVRPRPTSALGKNIDATSQCLLDVKDLEVSFFVMARSAAHELPAVRSVSFQIREGERVGLVGESGSGKTVTALSILGLLATNGQVVGGSIRHRGRELVGAPPKAHRKLRGSALSYVPQDPMNSLHPMLRVGFQVAECLIVHRGMGSRDAERHAVELLDRVGIPDAEDRARSYPHELSGGQRQRVAIAMALANQPDLIIADEPTTALDVTTQARILDLLGQLSAEQGMALLFITHDLGVVSALCDRVLVMNEGRLVEAAPTEQIFDDPRQSYTKQLIASVPRLGAARAETETP